MILENRRPNQHQRRQQNATNAPGGMGGMVAWAEWAAECPTKTQVILFLHFKSRYSAF